MTKLCWTDEYSAADSPTPNRDGSPRAVLLILREHGRTTYDFGFADAGAWHSSTGMRPTHWRYLPDDDSVELRRRIIHETRMRRDQFFAKHADHLGRVKRVRIVERGLVLEHIVCEQCPDEFCYKLTT